MDSTVRHYSCIPCWTCPSSNRRAKSSSNEEEVLLSWLRIHAGIGSGLITYL